MAKKAKKSNIKKKVVKKEERKISEGKLWAILSYVFCSVFLWVVPLWIIKPKDKFAAYHAKQALALFIIIVAAYIATWVLMLIPVLGWLLVAFGWIFIVVLWIIGIVNAANDRMVPLPVIGKIADKFDF